VFKESGTATKLIYFSPNDALEVSVYTTTGFLNTAGWTMVESVLWAYCMFCAFVCLHIAVYFAARGSCEPVCRHGCQFGRCILPDTCRCDFSYVGANCSAECACNKHSNCAGVTEL